MAITQGFKEGELDPGESYYFTDDIVTIDGKEVVRKVHARVGLVDPSVSKALTRKYGKSEIQIKGKRDRKIPFELADEKAEVIERAINALRDTTDFYMGVGGPAFAEHLGKLIGESLKPGQEVSIDGRWTPDVKEFLLNLPVLYGFAEFVNVKAGVRTARAAEDEQGKD